MDVKCLWDAVWLRWTDHFGKDRIVILMLELGLVSLALERLLLGAIFWALVVCSAYRIGFLVST